MFKFVVVAFVALCGASALANKETNWVDMKSECAEAVRGQIQMEVDASYVYLAMGAYFSRDEVNMPGFAKMFFEHASEERSHALGLIKYMLMRGAANRNNQMFTQGLISVTEETMPVHNKWANGLAAMEAALAKEKEVTDSIRNVISQCEDVKDYHITDYLTGEYLEEQYNGMRELAGKITTLKRMAKESNALGHFLFDKQLLA